MKSEGDERLLWENPKEKQAAVHSCREHIRGK